MNHNSRLQRFGLASLIITVTGAACGLSIAGDRTSGSGGVTSTTDIYASLPATMTLTAIVRDFKWPDHNGHADFERVPTQGYGHYVGQVHDALDADGKPVFKSTGYKVSTQALDSAGRQIMPVSKSYLATQSGDRAGAIGSSQGGSTTTAAAFAQWYRDVPNVNLSKNVSLTLKRIPNTNMYSFSDKTDSAYTAKGGFFPIDADLWGNPSGQTKNFGFTCELDTKFVYKRGAGQVFTFTGDDDVFVFIDKKLVVDIGGVHAAVSQSVDLDRLSWLEDGKTYQLKLFFAERHTTQSNVRIDTTINLVNAELPASAGLYD